MSVAIDRRRILVFGASGFLGGHVCALLAGEAVLIRPRRAQLDLLTASTDTLRDLVRVSRPDAVVACCGRLGGDMAQLVGANTMVTAKLIEAIAVAAPEARLVRIGSAGEYGSVPEGHAVREDDPTYPTSPYGVSHLAATRLVEIATTGGQIDGVVLRIFNPVGPGLGTENALGRAAVLLREAVRNGLDHIEMGPLDAFRDHVDVRDAASAVRCALTAGGLSQRVFNVGSGRAVRMRQAVELLARAAGFRGEVWETVPPAEAARSAAVGWMRADISAARHALGWTPRLRLDESVTALWAAESVQPLTGVLA